jgi:catechol 2,3-dioxygenase-like lactoylglutathione lyase family enzyme
MVTVVEGGEMTVGPIEAVRVFTTRLADARRFYAESLGLNEVFATDAVVMFDTGQAKLIVERVGIDDPEASGLVGRFTAFSFTVSDMETTLNDLRHRAIEWLGPPERQSWGGVLSFLKDPDGNILTLVQYPELDT